MTRLIVRPDLPLVDLLVFVAGTSSVESKVKQVDGEIEDIVPETEDETEQVDDGEGKSCVVFGMVGADMSIPASVKPRSALPMPSFGERGESEWKMASRLDGGMTVGEERWVRVGVIRSGDMSVVTGRGSNGSSWLSQSLLPLSPFRAAYACVASAVEHEEEEARIIRRNSGLT